MITDADHLDKDEMAREDVSDIVFAWSRNGRTEQISHTLDSMSGDNFLFSISVYRSDRSLAFKEFSYSGFAPINGEVTRTNFYGRDGGVLKSSTSWKQLGSDKDLPKSVIKESELTVAEFFDELPVYSSIYRLPYVDLISK